LFQNLTGCGVEEFVTIVGVVILRGGVESGLSFNNCSIAVQT